MDLKDHFIKVPVHFAEWCLVNKKTIELSLYIALKTRCDGQIRLNPDLKRELAEQLGYKSSRSVENGLRKLLELNWIGYNERSGIYFIRGWKFVLSVNHIEGTTTAELDLRKDLANMKQWIFANAVGHYIARRKKSEFKKSNSKQKDNLHDDDTPAPLDSEENAPNKLGVRVLCKRYNVSQGTISNWKRQAKDHGYLNYTHNYHILNIPAMLIHEVRELFSDIAHKIVILGEWVAVQLTDTFFVDAKFSTSRHW